MDTTPRIRRLGTVAAALVAVTALAGCVIPVPGSGPQPSSEPSTAPASSAPATNPVEASEPPVSEPPAEAQYELQNDAAAAVVWSFEPVEAQRVDADSLGRPADAGQQLVILHVSGQLLSGSPDFYYQFTVQGYDPATSQTIGLSSATAFYAEDDLFTIGRQEEFTNADAIFQLPEGWDISNWRIVCNETGEEWIVQVPVV